MKKVADLKVPKGPRRGREIPLIGVADVSLRGLESPKEGEQKTFCSPSFSIDLNAFLFLLCGDGRTIRAISRGSVEYCNILIMSAKSIVRYYSVYLQNSKFLRNFLRKFKCGV